MSLYRIYIDEVGNHDMQVKTVTDPNRQYLTLFGVAVEKDYMLNTLQPEMNIIKRRFFQQDPDEPIIFHRTDIANRRNQFHSLWDETKQNAFGEAMLHAYRRWQYHVMVVTIDKKAHLAQYGEWHRPPYVYCLQVLMERYILFLRGKRATGDVMIEARGKREDRELAQAYGDFFLAGSSFVSSDTWQNHLTTKRSRLTQSETTLRVYNWLTC